MGFWFFLFFRIFKPYDLYSILIKEELRPKNKPEKPRKD